MDSIGLGSALKEFPSLAVPVLVSLAVLEAIVPHVPIASALPIATIKPLLYVLATLLGLIQYSLGNFWDEAVFDRLYSQRAGSEKRRFGRWLNRTDRPWFVFPAGRPLRLARVRWNRRARRGHRGYAGAAEVVRQAGRWSEVEGPLVLSKFARSFIWPALLVAAVCAAATVGRSSTGAVEAATEMLQAALIAVAVAAGTFVPYFEFRVEHMSRLYRLATALTPRLRIDLGGEVRDDTPSSKGEPPRSDSLQALIVALLAALAGYLFSSMQTPTLTTESFRREITESCRDCRAQDAGTGTMRQDLAAIRSLLERNATVRGSELPNPPVGRTLPADMREIPVEGTTDLGRAAWVLLALGLGALIIGVPILIFAKGVPAKTAGALLATAGGLSLGGFALVKELKVDSVFKISDLTLFTLKREIQSSLGTIGPERIGEVVNFESGERAKVKNFDLDGEVKRMAASWIEKRQQHKDGVLLIVGGTDRLPLAGATQSQYDANVGLARARAEFIKERLIARVKDDVRARSLDKALNLQPEQVLVLVSGPRQTPELPARVKSAGEQTGFPEDRRVDVWAFWNSAPTDTKSGK